MQHNTLYGLRALGIAALSSTLLLAGAPGVFAQPGEQTVTLDNGSVLDVRLNNTLSSRNAQRGDTFSATVTQNRSSNDYGLPPGTRVEGVVEDVRRHHGDNPGMLDLSFRHIQLPDGRSYSIDGSLIGLDNKSVSKIADGSLIATPSHRNNRLTYVGYGAGAGLVVGLLTNNRNALTDTLLGGGLGYLYGALEKGKSNPRDVTLRSGTDIGVRIDRPVTLAVYNPDTEGYQNTEGYRNTESRFHRSRESFGNGNMMPNNNGSDFNSIGVMLGNTNVNFNGNAQPVMWRRAVLVPARPVLDQASIPFTLGYRDRYIRASGPGGTVRLAVGSSIAVVNNRRRVRLDAPAQILNGTLYVPMRFFGLVMGRPVMFDSGSQTVLIDTGNTQNFNSMP
jgi:hypothetical protein